MEEKIKNTDRNTRKVEDGEKQKTNIYIGENRSILLWRTSVWSAEEETEGHFHVRLRLLLCFKKNR